MTFDHALGPSTHLRVSASVYVRAFGEELVLLDFGRGEYFGLDHVAAEIWRGIEGGESLGCIADRITERYEVSHDAALADVLSLATHMLEQGLLTE